MKKAKMGEESTILVRGHNRQDKAFTSFVSHTHIHTHTNIYIYIYIYIYTHVYTHTHTHTHTAI